MTAMWLNFARADVGHDVVHDVVLQPRRPDWRERLGPCHRPESASKRKQPVTLAPVRRPIRRPQTSLAL